MDEICPRLSMKSTRMSSEFGVIRSYGLRYLPGIKLPSNIKAYPDIREAVKNATVLVFNLPHQVHAGLPLTH